MDSKLKIEKTEFEGLYIVESVAYEDNRGSFSRIFCQEELNYLFYDGVKQINHSITKEKGTVRGLHFQYEPYCEDKMIRCIRGSICDIVIDIRKNSATFLKSFKIKLSKENKKMLFIPKGFAHGFQSLEDNSELIYLHSSIYMPNKEGALNVRDPRLNLDWPLQIKNLSERDENHAMINENFKGVEVNEL